MQKRRFGEPKGMRNKRRLLAGGSVFMPNLLALVSSKKRPLTYCHFTPIPFKKKVASYHAPLIPTDEKSVATAGISLILA
jgi:hypothetical protein